MAHERADRAYRPSHFTPREDFDELARHEREENLARYILRAQAGLPLFDPAAIAVTTQSPPQGG